MGRAIGTDQTGPVQGQHHGQFLQGHVVDELVVRALQKGGINGHHGFYALAGQPGGKGDGMLLGNAHVVIAVREAPMKLHHARAFAHRRGDAHQALVLRGHVAQPLAKHLGKGGLGGGGGRDNADLRVELARAVVSDGVHFGQLVALAFFGDHVQKLRAVQLADVLQRGDEGVEVVPVDGADVVEAEILKQRGRHHHAFGMLLQLFRQLQQRGDIFQHAFAHATGGGVKLAAHQLRQIAVQRPHRWADAHVVVVQDDQQIAIEHPGVVHGLKGHAGRHGPVANHRNGAALFALALGGHGHAQGGRDAGRRVRGAKGVVRAFAAHRKARDAAQLAQRGHALAPTGEDFVRVGLVAHVPHDAVVGGVEDVVQRHRQLHRAQVGAQMPPGFRDAVEHVGPQLVGQHRQLGAGQHPQVGRIVDFF